MAVLPAPVRVPSQWSFAPNVMSVAKGKSELCTDLLAFTLQLRKNLENLSKETVEEGCAPSHSHQMGSFTSKRRQ